MDDFMRRLGRFRISMEMIRESTAEVRLALSGMLIVRAEQMFESDAIEYVAASEYFEPVEQGCRAPEYTPRLTKVPLDDGAMGLLVSGWTRV